MYKDKEGLLSEKALISKEGNTISSAVWLVLEKDKTKGDYQMYLYQKKKENKVWQKKKNYASKHLRRKRRRRSLKGMKNLAVRRKKGNC